MKGGLSVRSQGSQIFKISVGDSECIRGVLLHRNGDTNRDNRRILRVEKRKERTLTSSPRCREEGD